MAGLSTLALLAISAAKTGLDYTNQRRAAKAVDTTAGFEADLLQKNAGYADEQAADAVARGHEASVDALSGQRQLAGAQRAAFAASGVDITSGSAAAVQQSDALMSAEERRRIENNAARAAHGFQVEADNYRQQAQLTRMGGHNQAVSLRDQSVGTLLGGAGQLAAIWQTAPKSVGSGSGAIPPVPKTPVAPRPPAPPFGGRY